MTFIDLVVVALSVALLLGAGFWAAKRRGSGTNQFILAGRRLPWWLAGTAMVAGGTNADSPLHQSGKIRRDGLAGAWFYWSQIIAYVWHALVFSRLWRRAEVNTVVEFYEIRYSGLGAKLGRLWSMLMTSLVHGTFVVAVSLLAMIKICQALLGLQAPVELPGFSVAPEIAIVLGGIVLALAYTTVAGFLGVVAGDLVEFLLAIVCSYALMVIVYKQVGFSAGLTAGLEEAGRGDMLSFLPPAGIALLVFFVVQPLCMVAGDASLNQRFLAVRDERQAVFSGIWRLVNHYFIRCWPWYVCGLASIVLFAGMEMPGEMAYPRLVAEFMPDGWRGLMFAGFLVGFMSSVGSAMHNSGSVFVNDLYRPYLVRHASDAHYVWIIRVAMVGVAVIATIIALLSQHILGLLQTMITITASSGLVMLLRWFWWRVNGWADFAAQFIGLPVALYYSHGPGRNWVKALADWSGQGGADDLYGISFIITVATTTLLWLVVMFATRPEPDAQLMGFFRRVRPYGFWRPVAALCPDVVVADRFSVDLRRYVLGLVLCLGLLFGMGLLLLGRPVAGCSTLALAVVAGVVLVRDVGRINITTPPRPAQPRHTPVSVHYP